MSSSGRSEYGPRDVRRTLHLPPPKAPGTEMLLSLARAGLSDRSLRAISSRETVKGIRAQLKRESEQKRATLKAAERRAAIFSAIRGMVPWLAIGFLAMWATHLIGLISLEVALVATPVAALAGRLAWRIFAESDEQKIRR